MQYTNIKKYITNKFISFLIISFSLGSCSSFNIKQEFKDIVYFEDKNINNTQEKLLNSALKSTKIRYSTKLLFDSKSFNNDCSGLINGIFYEAGIDLITITSNETGNGVKRIHNLLKKKNLLHNNKIPNVGDIIFWNNTYGTWGKNPLSHVGIVVSVDKKTGDIDYVHNNTYLGAIRRESMNLYKPHENRPTNNYMRYDSTYKKTSAELFDSFGMAWKL